MCSSPHSILSPQQRRTAHSIEVLEQRIAPTTFTVNSTADGGPGSLRQAILDANSDLDPDPDLINFNFTDGSGPFVIRPTAALPAITDLVTIDGYSQVGTSQNSASEGTNAVIRVVLDGSFAGGVDGLTVIGDECEKSKITGLAIVNFQKSGLFLDSKDITVVGNFIGVLPDGGTAGGNGASGVSIFTQTGTGTGHAIGKSADADRNLISGNGSAGVTLLGGSAVITGNLIGTNNFGTGAVGNVGNGVFLGGGSATIEANVISGNTSHGIQLSGVTGAFIRDNLIGLDAQGGLGLGNGGDGILLTGGSTLTSVSGNTISSNLGNGVTITGTGTNQNTLQSNDIGTGGDALPNGLHGVLVTAGAKFNRIGGASEDGNYIASHESTTESGESAAGVTIRGVTTTDNAISGNVIVANYNGIWIDDAANNSIGADETGAGNRIRQNSNAGIFIDGPLATGNVIAGNTIGLDGGEGGDFAAPNGTGIHIYNAADNTIGGTTSADRNWIAGNTGDGILIDKQDQYYAIGENDFFPTTPTPVITQAAFTAAQVGEGAPLTTLFTSGQTITLNFDDAFESGEPSFFVRLWNLNTLQSGNQIASVTFDGVAQDVSQFEANLLGAGRDHSGYFYPDAALLTDGHLTVAITLGTLPASQKVGIDHASLSIYKRSQNAILGNTIGGATDDDATLNNGGSGIHTNSTDGVTIGDGTTAGANLISGNNGPGIHLQYGSGAVVRGNIIGSTSMLPVHATNATGVLIEGSYSNRIGGSGAGDRNVISGNTGDGVSLISGSSSNVVVNNAIGTDAAGLAARANGGNGVSLLGGASYNYIGSTTDLGNVISGNRGNGVLISDLNTTGNQILANHIGTNATGTGALGNSFAGLRIQSGASGNDIGDGSVAAGNTISGNGSDGVTIFDANGNNIDGNRIGTTGDGLGALGNIGRGVFVIGDSNVIENNVISANLYAGVELSGTNIVPRGGFVSDPIYAEFNVVRANLIGLDADAENPLPNADGVVIRNGASDNRVGGTAAFDGNHIAYNEDSLIGFSPGVIEEQTIISFGQGDGVRVEDGSVRNALLGNSIHDNAGYGINLDGGNNDQTAPTLSAALIKHGTMIFKGSFTSTPNTTFRIEMFVADGIDGALSDSEGETLLGSFEVTTNASGFVTYRKTLPTAVPAGTLITGTATALASVGTPTDTSQFADAIKAIPTIEITGGALVEGNAGDKSLNFLISLGATPENGTASVLYSTGDFSNDARSATADVDYDAFLNSPLNIVVSNPLADPLTRQLSVAVHGDTASESRERFKLLLSNPSGVGFDDGGDQGVGVIIDDDQHTFAVGSVTGSKVQIFNSVDGSLLREFTAFEPAYKGGARVATGDVNGDGINDIIVGTGTGGGGRVRVFDGASTSTNPTPLFDFRPFGGGYRGAVNVAAGDVNGDGRAELIASTGAGSATEVRVIDLDAKGGPNVVSSFKAFYKVSNGVRVASGDLDGDGLADIIATNGLTSEVRTFHGDGTAFTGAIAKFNAFGKLPRGGLFAAAGDLDADGRDDLLFSPATSVSEVRSFLTTVFTANPVRTFTPFPGLLGTRLAITDVNSDGIADIVAAQGPSRTPAVSIFNGSNNVELLKIIGVTPGGVFVG